MGREASTAVIWPLFAYLLSELKLQQFITFKAVSNEFLPSCCRFMELLTSYNCSHLQYLLNMIPMKIFWIHSLLIYQAFSSLEFAFSLHFINLACLISHLTGGHWNVSALLETLLLLHDVVFCFGPHFPVLCDFVWLLFFLYIYDFVLLIKFPLQHANF